MSEIALGYMPPGSSVDITKSVEPKTSVAKRVIQYSRSRMGPLVRDKLPAVTAAVVLGINPATVMPAPPEAPKILQVQETSSLINAYQLLKDSARGNWSSLVTEIGNDGSVDTLITDNPDREVEAASVNKLAIAMAVLDRVDKGAISLRQEIEITQDMLAPDGITKGLGEKKTVEEVLREMIVHSDNLAVRMIQKVLAGDAINTILQEKGLQKTQLKKDPDTGRYFLGTTTPRDMIGFLTRLIRDDPTLLSSDSCDLLMQWMQESSYTDGIKHYLTDEQRQHSYSKWGGLENLRNEVGIFTRPDGSVVIYGFFTGGLNGALRDGGPQNQHPVVQAHQQLGRFIAKL